MIVQTGGASSKIVDVREMSDEAILHELKWRQRKVGKTDDRRLVSLLAEAKRRKIHDIEG